MICKFCGYTHGWGWFGEYGQEYVKVDGQYGDFYRSHVKRLDSSGVVKYNVLMCPNPECQRTQLEE